MTKSELFTFECGDKTGLETLKIHSFLNIIFKTVWNKNYKQIPALKYLFQSFSLKKSRLTIILHQKLGFIALNYVEMGWKWDMIMKLWKNLGIMSKNQGPIST